MELRNPLSKFQADELYAPKNDIIRQDLLDNNIDYVLVGDTAVDREIRIEYSFELPISDVAQTGVIVLVQDTNGIDFDHHYSFVVELDEVIFSADISGTSIRIRIETISLGENPTIKYRRTAIGIVV